MLPRDILFWTLVFESVSNISLFFVIVHGKKLQEKTMLSLATFEYKAEIVSIYLPLISLLSGTNRRSIGKL